MSPAPTVLLFDIDGTLVDMKGAGRRAMDRAFVELTGKRDLLGFSFAGQTDPLIFGRGLTNAGLEVTATHVEELTRVYLEALVEEARLGPAPGTYPGVHELLTSLSDLDNVVLGVGTGNLEAGAKVKLSCTELEHFFSFGGYGSDHGIRDKLIAVGLHRGARQLGRPPEECRLVVIGDTNHDIRSAHASGAICLAVATGPSSVDDLLEFKADIAFADLAQPGVREALLGIAH